jgi:hypothetical protein
MLILKIFSAITFVAMLLVNYLANSIPIGGNTTGDISAKYNTLFTPSGFTFSIWLVIYVLLSVFVISIFINPEVILTSNRLQVLILFCTVNVFNILWLLSWHNDRILLSTVFMVILLVLLLTILRFISKSDLLSYVTFSIYSGWISVALIANIAIFIVKKDYGFFMNNQYLWLFIALGLSFIIGVYMAFKHKNYYYSAVFLWAYFGILTKLL